MAAAWPAVSALAAVLAAFGLALWCGRPVRARDRLPGHQAPEARHRPRLRRVARSAAGDSLAVALAVDLIAACLEAGVPLPPAMSAASAVADTKAAAALESTATALRRGGGADSWDACETDPRLEAVARICRRIGTTGAAVADDLRRAAGEMRRADQAERRRRAQRAAVWVVLPLGLCFLPAFLLLTVIPVVTALLPGLR